MLVGFNKHTGTFEVNANESSLLRRVPIEAVKSEMS